MAEISTLAVVCGALINLANVEAITPAMSKNTAYVTFRSGEMRAIDCPVIQASAEAKAALDKLVTRDQGPHWPR